MLFISSSSILKIFAYYYGYRSILLSTTLTIFDYQSLHFSWKILKVLTLFIGVLQELDNHTVKKWDYISARANQSKKAQPFQFSVSCCEKNDFTQIMFYKSVFFLRLFLFEFVRHCLDCLRNLSSSSSSSISRWNLYSKRTEKRNTWFDFAYSQSAFLSIKDRFDWIFRLDC